jgi:hypothetical protein
MVSFMPWLLSPPEEEPLVPIGQKAGLQSWSGHGSKEKKIPSLHLPGIESWLSIL